MAKRIDWAKLEYEYITGSYKEGGKYLKPSCKYLAEKHGCSLAAVEKKSRERSWTAKRKEHMDNITEAMSEKRKKNLVDRATKFDGDMFALADAIKSIIFKKMSINKSDGTTKLNENLSTIDLQRFTQIGNQLMQLRTAAVGDTGSSDENSLDKLCDILDKMQTDDEEEI